MNKLRRDHTNPLQVLITGDNHLGYNQYKSEARKDDFLQAFTETIDIAIDNKVDAFVNTGDLFHDSQPDIKTVQQCTHQIKRLEEHNIPFLAIVGNHERKRETQWVDLLGQLSNVHRLSNEPTIISNSEYGVSLYGFDAIRKYDWESADLSLTPPSNNKHPRIAVMHELVSPLVPHGLHDYEVETILDRFNLDIDMLGLSDYHEPIETTVNSVEVFYSGATEKTSYDQPNSHSVVLVNIGNLISKKRIQLTTPRPFITETFTTTSGLTFETLVEDFPELNTNHEKDPVVVIKLEGTNKSISTKRIRKYFLQNGAEVVRSIDNRNSNQEKQELTVNNVQVEKAIDEKLAQQAVSEMTQKVNNIAQDLEIPNSHVREQTRNLLTGDTNEN